MKIRLKNQRGLALINALIIVAALAAVAVFLLQKAQSARLRQSLIQQVAQARAYLDGVELLVLGILDDDRRASDFDHLREAWARPDYRFDIDRGRANVSISDLQGRFNLNAMASGSDQILGVPGFETLIVELGLPIEMAAVLLDWVSEGGPDQKGRYLNTAPRLMPRGGALELLDELRLIRPMKDRDFAALSKGLTVVSSEGSVNVNTAHPAVIKALLREVSAGKTEAMIAARDNEPFESEEDLAIWMGKTFSEKDLENPALALFVVSSNWFQADISVSLDQTILKRRLVITRSGETGRSKVRFRLTPKD